MRNRIFSLVAVAMMATAGSALCLAQDSKNDSTIVEYMVRDSDGRVQIYQPGELGARLKAENGNPDNGQKKAAKHQVGYRIQVFADNNQRTAKNEAMTRERQVSALFPDVECYLSYKAPAWRLRVGDFKTREEAVAVMRQMKKAFPGYSREMIVVTDRINTAAL